jgi:Ca2+-binding EF-hand superfamily protein
MSKKDMLKCYKDLSTCDMDKVEHVVNAIYQAFDTDNDGKVGRNKIVDVIIVFVLIEFEI